MKLKSKATGNRRQATAKSWLSLVLGTVLAAFGACGALAEVTIPLTAYEGQTIQYTYTNESASLYANLMAEGVVISDSTLPPHGTVTLVFTNATDKTYKLYDSGDLLATFELTCNGKTLDVEGEGYAETIQGDEGLLWHMWSLAGLYGEDNLDVQLTGSTWWWARVTAEPLAPGFAGFTVRHTTPLFAREDFPRSFAVFTNQAESCTIAADAQGVTPLTLQSADAGAWAAWSEDPDVVKVSVEGDGDTCTPVLTAVTPDATGTIHVENAFVRYTITVRVAPEEMLPVSLPTNLEGGEFVVSNLTDGVEIEKVDGAYDLPVGKKVGIYAVPVAGYENVSDPLIIDPVKKDTVITADMLPQLARTGELFPNGDGGKFVPAAKGTVSYEGAVLGANGIEGIVQLKMKKPNKNGLIDITAAVKTVDKQNLSFKAKNVLVPAAGPLTVALEGSSAKSKIHTLKVTLEGNSMTGTFDQAVVDGASDAFKDKKSARAAAIAPFIGTWTGAFAGESAEATMYYSAVLSKNGKAKVKVILPDGKSVSCNGMAEVGDDVIVVPVTVRKLVKGFYERFSFRLAFIATKGGEFVCRAVDVSTFKVAHKDTGAVVEDMAMVASDAGALTVTPKAFKTFTDVKVPGVEAKLGAPTKVSLKMAKTGVISGTIKWGKVSGKASGIVIGDMGFGTVTAKVDGVEVVSIFTAAPVKK